AELASAYVRELAPAGAASAGVVAGGGGSGHSVDGIAAPISTDERALNDHRTSQGELVFLTPEPAEGATPIPEISIDVHDDSSPISAGEMAASRSQYRPTPPPIPRDAMTPVLPADDFAELAPPEDAPELSGDAYAETTTF